MTRDQEQLLLLARESLDAATTLYKAEHFGFAAARAYYTMFYVAEAFLIGDGLAFSKHSAVHAAFGKRFAKTGILPSALHGYLVRAAEVRHTGDYGGYQTVTASEAELQIQRAQEFLTTAEKLIGRVAGRPETP